MLPVALTCPLWWVARWTARMLTSLAVVVAFSLGAASLPLGPVVAGGAGSGPVAAASGAPDATDSTDSTGTDSTGTGFTEPAAGPLAQTDALPPAAAGHSVSAVAASRRVPAGLAPEAAGPRAPPGA
ncbi:hypothetical protein E1258_07810 [Micromonospora sp. KC207]|uniref:hypothetical protein n=1 Tax=Micromonospora sp. KC207 TaxID=2530377 RepID=UPI0010532EDA|nr:hypothetical protein [Micromonospora sp. KC207]TDC64642.1 hypothetical protein E1258_07810 [Micromonospora sp. KC207]